MQIVETGAQKVVFVSYRYGDTARFDLVLALAVRLRQYSFEVVLDQRSLRFGEDINEFMRTSIERADAVLFVVTRDYSEALCGKDIVGAGVRFEICAVLEERARRPNLQLVPLLLITTCAERSTSAGLLRQHAQSPTCEC